MQSISDWSFLLGHSFLLPSQCFSGHLQMGSTGRVLGLFRLSGFMLTSSQLDQTCGTALPKLWLVGRVVGSGPVLCQSAGPQKTVVHDNSMRRFSRKRADSKGTLYSVWSHILKGIHTKPMVGHRRIPSLTSASSGVESMHSNMPALGSLESMKEQLNSMPRTGDM